MKKTNKRQLRGEALERRIKAAIHELAAEAKRAGTSFTYNATKVAEQVPTTRKTLRAHDDLVERVLTDLDARRRMVDGNATVEHLRELNSRLREQVEDRDKTISVLRSHCVDIYQRLLANSIEAANLIRPIVEAESSNVGHCLLCGGETNTSPHQSNIVPLKERK